MKWRLPLMIQPTLILTKSVENSSAGKDILILVQDFQRNLQVVQVAGCTNALMVTPQVTAYTKPACMTTTAFVPAFDDSVSGSSNPQTCGTRTCTSDSTAFQWNQTQQKFLIVGQSAASGVCPESLGSEITATLRCKLTDYAEVQEISSTIKLRITDSCWTTQMIWPTIQQTYTFVVNVTTNIHLAEVINDTYSQSQGLTRTSCANSIVCTEQYNSQEQFSSCFGGCMITSMWWNSKPGTFTNSFSCRFSGGIAGSRPAEVKTFTINNAPCSFTSYVPTTLMSATDYTKTTVLVPKTINIDTVRSTSPNNCSGYQYTYFVEMQDGSTDFSAFGGTLTTGNPAQLRLSPTSNTQVGTYNLRWYPTTTQNTSLPRIYTNFQVIIGECVITNVWGTGFPSNQLTVIIFDTAKTFPFVSLTQDPGCTYPATISCITKLTSDSTWGSQTWCQHQTTVFSIQSNDKSLHNQIYNVKQRVAIRGTNYSPTQQLTVTFFDPCTTSAFVTQQIDSKVYFISSLGQSMMIVFPKLQDTVNNQYGSSAPNSICGNQNVAITDQGTQPKYAQITALPDGSTQVIVQTTDGNLAGVHRLIASYTFQSYSNILATNVQSIISFFKVTYPLVQDQIYAVQEPLKQFKFSNFDVIPSSLVDSKLQITLIDGMNLPIPVSYEVTATEIQFKVFSTDAAFAGNYTIKISTQLSYAGFKQDFYTQFLLVVQPPQTKFNMIFAPKFEQPIEGTFYLLVGQDWNYNLPAYKDPQNLDVTLSVDLGKAFLFTYVQNNKLMFFTQTTQENLGAYQINIQLTNSANKKTEYQIKLIIFENQSVKDVETPYNYDSEIIKILRAQEGSETWNWIEQYLKAVQNGKNSQTKSKPLNAKISKIDSLGKVTVSFSQKMMVPPLKIFKQIAEPLKPLTKRKLLVNFQDQFAANAISIKTILGDTYSNVNLKFNYTVEKYVNNTLQLQLHFENASHVSQNLEYDSLQIDFTGYYFFFSMDGQFLPKDSSVRYKLPPQLQYGTQATQIFTAAVEAISTTSQVILTGNLALNFLLQAAVNQLIGAIRILQIVCMLPLFNTRMPANASQFFSILLSFVSFDIFPVTELYDLFVDSSDANKILNPNFEQIGIVSTLFIYNMGSLIYMFFAIPVQLLFYALLKPLSRYTIVTNRRQSIWNSMFWQQIIGTTVEGFLIIWLCVLINSLQMQFDTFWQAVNTVLTYIFGAFLIIFPILNISYILGNFKNLENKQHSVGNFYSGLDLRRGKSIAVQVLIFFLRRIVVPITVVYNEYLIVQIMALCYTTVAQVIVFGQIKPQDGGLKAYWNDIFSEYVLLNLIYTFMMFTDFVPDLDSRFLIGYVACVIVSIHLLLNFIQILVGVFKNLILQIKGWHIKRIHKQKLMDKLKAECQMNSESRELGVIYEVSSSKEYSSNRNLDSGSGSSMLRSPYLDQSTFSLHKKVNTDENQLVTFQDHLDIQQNPQEKLEDSCVQLEIPPYKTSLLDQTRQEVEQPNQVSELQVETTEIKSVLQEEIVQMIELESQKLEQNKIVPLVFQDENSKAAMIYKSNQRIMARKQYILDKIKHL